MNEAIYLPMALWAAFSVVLVMRGTLPVYIRILLVLVFGLYAGFFYDDLIKLQNFSSLPLMEILKKSVQFAMYSLVWVWPMTLLFSIYSSQDHDVKVVLSIASIFTIVILVSYLFVF